MNYKQEYGLPNSLKGKSFAAAAKHIEGKFKDRNSIFDLNTKKELLSRLRDVQEMRRQKLENKTNKVEGQQQYGEGGPLTFSSIGDAWSQRQNRYNAGFGNPDTNTSNSFGRFLQTDNSRGNSGGGFGKLKSYVTSEGGQERIAQGVGLAASILGPMLANRNAMKNLHPAKKILAEQLNSGSVQPNFVNRQQLLRNAAEQSNTPRYNMAQTGGDWGQYTQNAANINANVLNSTGNIMLGADMADNAEKTRVQQGKQGIEEFNLGQRQRAEEMNAQNQAAYDSTMAQYKQAQGANLGAAGMSLFNYINAKKTARAAGYASTLRNT